VQTGLGVFVAFCKMGGGYLSLDRGAERGVYHPPPRSAVRLPTHHASSGMIQGDLYLYHALSLDRGWRKYGTRHFLLSHFLKFLLLDQRLCIVKSV